MRRHSKLFADMDARAWRTLAASVALFGGVALVFLFGAQVLGFDGETTIEEWLGAAHGPWSLPAAVVAFAALAFVGAPQFMLIAAAVVVFGPWMGFAYSWVGTMVSAVVGFYVGRAGGARTMRLLSGKPVQQFMALIGRNGFMASLVVRLAPSAPFIVVNMAAGVTPMRVTQFAAGTAIGIIPKIALTAFAGASIARILKGGPAGPAAAGLVLFLAAWIVIGWFAIRWLKSRERGRPGGPPSA